MTSVVDLRRLHVSLPHPSRRGDANHRMHARQVNTMPVSAPPPFRLSDVRTMGSRPRPGHPRVHRVGRVVCPRGVHGGPCPVGAVRARRAGRVGNAVVGRASGRPPRAHAARRRADTAPLAGRRDGGGRARGRGARGGAQTGTRGTMGCALMRGRFALDALVAPREGQNRIHTLGE